MHLLKDRLTRDLQKLNNILPSVTPSICTPVASTEVEFLDENMKFELPHQQLLVNEDLVSSDLGAVGVQWRENSNLKQIKINPAIIDEVSNLALKIGTRGFFWNCYRNLRIWKTRAELAP